MFVVSRFSLGRSNRSVAVLCLIGLLVGACASPPPLQRPIAGSLVLGETRLAAVIDQFGTPSRRKTLTIRQCRIDSLVYSYMDPDARAHAARAESVRGLYLYFDQGTLAGYNYLSSFAEDHTDFDQNLIERLVEGRSGRDQVIALFGEPSGESAYPLAKRKGQTDLVYCYVETVLEPFGSGETRTKTLVISVDGSGIVRKIDYREAVLK